MDTHLHPIIAGAAGLVFACLGFSLSVLATLLGIVVPISAAPALVEVSRLGSPRRRGRRSQRVIHRNNQLTTSSPSRLSPLIIIVDEPERDDPSSQLCIEVPSPEPLPDRSDQAKLPESGSRAPAIISSPTMMGPTSLPADDPTDPFAPFELAFVVSQENHNGFKLSNLARPWKAKKPKLQTSSAPTSPNRGNHSLPRSPSPSPPPDVRRRPGTADAALCCKKGTKMLRKVRSSVEISPAKCRRSLDKKQSQSLRTQPYEAPYFFPPPVPVPDNVAHRKKSVRSRTMPPPETQLASRSRSPSPTLARATTLAPPDHY